MNGTQLRRLELNSSGAFRVDADENENEGVFPATVSVE
jgi:hypothetical protein